MADLTDKVSHSPTTPGFPAPHLPSVVIDGFVNFAPIGGLVRAYMYRTDPDTSGLPDFRNQVIGQIMMPNHAFLNTFVFMEAAIERFISTGAFSRKELEDVRAAFKKAELDNAK